MKQNNRTRSAHIALYRACWTHFSSATAVRLLFDPELVGQTGCSTGGYLAGEFDLVLSGTALSSAGQTDSWGRSFGLLFTISHSSSGFSPHAPKIDCAWATGVRLDKERSFVRFAVVDCRFHHSWHISGQLDRRAAITTLTSWSRLGTAHVEIERNAVEAAAGAAVSTGSAAGGSSFTATGEPGEAAADRLQRWGCLWPLLFVEKMDIALTWRLMAEPC